jgi:octaprenyl-diphosphate synthase
MRRGRPTANEQWNNPSSVLVGDFIYSRAFQILVSIGHIGIMQVIADTTNVIAEGEVLQLLNKHRVDTTEADYLRVISDKTAVLFQAAAYCGALIANADSALQIALKEAGMHIGLAFQLVDDALDYDGNTTELGKNIGDDLAEGKPTLPLIFAMQHASVEDQAIIRQSILTGGTDRLAEVIEIVVRCGALDYTRQVARQHADNAVAKLMQLPESTYRSALLQMCELAVSRAS